MDANIKFEIRARVFHEMTGMLAPGKDAREGPPVEDRLMAWEKWNRKNCDIVNAILSSVEYHREFI